MPQPDQAKGHFDVISWLNTFEPNAQTLQDNDIKTVMHFTLLWFLFEKQVCATHASVPCFERKIQQWSDAENLDLETFQLQLQYFQERYLDDGEPNQLFDELLLQSPDVRAQVVAVLKGEKQSAVDVGTAILTIVYRYRNNLFHGEKWIYDLPDQVEYFDVANQVLVQVLEIHKRSQNSSSIGR